jgi:glutamate dehydrogenase (NADP+)
MEGFIRAVAGRDPHQPEFLQAVGEVMGSVWGFIASHPEYADQALLERLVEPERVIQFRVSWVDDAGAVRVNRAFRVQHNSAIGPYKGGMRFHPSVNLSILKFLAFEQTFKNALTTLALGGGKGGADFDPRGRSEGEVMRFCQSLMLELHRHLGPDTDVPAGDIGVGAREIGFLAGMARKLDNSSACVFTGKGLSFGGSHLRPAATGSGLVYFVENMLARAGLALDGLRVAVSGSGNVALSAIGMAMQRGARVVSASDSSGVVHDPAGFTPEKLAHLAQLKAGGGRVADYAARHGLAYIEGGRPWSVPVDVALPCATQNELGDEDAATLLRNGVRCVAEGANMPCTPGAMAAFRQARIPYAPGKAANAGGVAVSGLEMAQNAQRLRWSAEEVDARLRAIMREIHASCLQYGTGPDGHADYLDGANIAGFVKVADAMRAQGVC